MTKDMMTPEQWAAEWHSRKIQTTKDTIKESLRQWAMRDFDRMLAMLLDSGGKKKMDVIELGCAPGIILKSLYLSRPIHTYFGIEYSLEGLAITRQFLTENKIEARLIHGDIRTYVPERTYDMVISFGLIEHFSHPVEILKAHKKFVNTDGVVIVSVPNLSNYYVQKALEKFRPVDLKTHNLDMMSEDALKKAFLEAGFQGIQTGGGVGPLLPTPRETPTLESKIYKYFSYIWNGSIRFIPPSKTWYGYYWAWGRPQSPSGTEQVTV
jgi:2-polyprenyl-3-methyl-5-hydroxy-6-metoxy-1,4-benzoquinol methylase